MRRLGGRLRALLARDLGHGVGAQVEDDLVAHDLAVQLRGEGGFGAVEVDGHRAAAALALRLDEHDVAGRRRALDRHQRRVVLAESLERLLDVGVGDLDGRGLDLDRVRVGERELRVEVGVHGERERLARDRRVGVEVRVDGGQVELAHGFGVVRVDDGLADLFGEGFGADALEQDAARRLAGPEARHPDLARERAEHTFEGGVDDGDGDRDLDRRGDVGLFGDACVHGSSRRGVRRTEARHRAGARRFGALRRGSGRGARSGT